MVSASGGLVANDLQALEIGKVVDMLKLLSRRLFVDGHRFPVNHHGSLDFARWNVPICGFAPAKI